MEDIASINMLPDVNLAQIFEKLPWQERLKIEQVCKNWQHVGKNFSWPNYKVFDNYEIPGLARGKSYGGMSFQIRGRFTL
ncbi:hypothetical protein DdX_20499 [Ditylenchus destructor]|uniref:F-box domain-containing protein n=1 Tax=Ditylenchus destructor TaxID=166010 RepID=A0AAD4MKP1_9BILA|nr:hypothetical protein DdX_20499 [Ditylenchus destructor]